MRIYTNETPSKVNEEIELAGWVDARRDHGKLIFIDLRDKGGLVQIVFNAKDEDLWKEADKLRPEWVVRVRGKVLGRPDNMINPELKTGEVEISAGGLEVISTAETPPFPLDTDGLDIDEEVRAKYRYLDLRRGRMQKNIRGRHRALKFMRDFLTDEGFVEIETPILGASSPEGARDYLIPSRNELGKFYALPQAPQQYKQLLMVAGFEKYFQIARVFRDEDTRGNRQPEFTQLDMEMSFMSQDEILDLTEKLFTKLVEELYPEKKITERPWPRINYKDAMEKYGEDDPDLRKDKDDKNELAFAWIVGFPLFTEQKEGDFFHGSGEASFAPSHHMFTAPHPDDVGLLETDPSRIRGLQHDIVLNGVEIGGGSVRIHKPEIQEKIFDLIGFTKEQKDQFSHILKAFKYGVPPHGGIAAGVDRFLALLFGEPNIREVIAFPKTGDGKDLMMDSPSEVDKKQLDDLGIIIKRLPSDGVGNEK